MAELSAASVPQGVAQSVDDMLEVSVCYATAREEFLRLLKVAPGTTIGAAIEMSGVLEAYPEINLSTQPVGIYAKKKTLDTVLRARDRIEIYRPLVADPKDSRRKRAAKKDNARPPAA
jgi:putative ubiquitin-RnfH superfamily antitoxin RatB of RatAB toxin-antitoxin module